MQSNSAATIETSYAGKGVYGAGYIMADRLRAREATPLLLQLHHMIADRISRYRRAAPFTDDATDLLYITDKVSCLMAMSSKSSQFGLYSIFVYYYSNN